MNPTYFDPMTHPATMRQAALMSGYDDDDGLSGLFSKIFKVASPLLSIAGPALAPFTGGASLGIAAAVNAIGGAVTSQGGGASGQAPPNTIVVPPPPPPAPPPPPPAAIAAAAAPSSLPPWLIPAALGGVALLLVLNKK